MASETMTVQEAIAIVSDMLSNHLRTPDDIAIETLLAHARAALAPQGVTVTESMVEAFLGAMCACTLDSRRPWHEDERNLVRKGLTAALRAAGVGA